MRDVLKNPRILIWLLFLVISVALISPNPFPSGFVVSYIEKNSTVTGISIGDIINKINDQAVNEELINREYYGTVKLDTNKGIQYFEANGTLGLDVEPVPISNLVFGLDIRGGVRAIVEPNASDNLTINSIISTLQTRINVYGLRESTLRPIWYEDKGFVEISMAGGNEEELRELLERQGRFEAKIPIIIRTDGGLGSLDLDEEYKISIEGNNSIQIDGEIIRAGEDFELAGILFVFEGINDDEINLTSLVYTGNDIVAVFFDPERSRIQRLNGGYKWFFSVSISNAGAERFAWITDNIPIAPVVPGDFDRYLESKIYLYLDGDLIDDLNIVAGLKGKVETSVMITGSADTLDEAKATRARLQSILRSGSLPTSIEVVQMDTVSPKLGAGFLTIAVFAGLAAMIAVVLVIFIRYRSIKFVFPTVVISLSEILIILGFAAAIKWTIDLAAIAAIIAAVGTGIDGQIIILDQTLRGEMKAWTVKEKIQRAFFIIFGAGGTTIAAMIPLMTIGFGLLRGFAIVTIVGVLAGILIARPAFGVIVEKMVGE